MGQQYVWAIKEGDRLAEVFFTRRECEVWVGYQQEPANYSISEIPRRAAVLEVESAMVSKTRECASDDEVERMCGTPEWRRYERWLKRLD